MCNYHNTLYSSLLNKQSVTGQRVNVTAGLKMSLTFDILIAGILGHGGWHAQRDFHTQGQRKDTNNNQEDYRWWTCTGELLFLMDYDISLDQNLCITCVVSLFDVFACRVTAMKVSRPREFSRGVKMSSAFQHLGGQYETKCWKHWYSTW